MRINVRLYSALRHRDGKIINGLTLDLAEGSSAADILIALEVNPELEPLISVNGALAQETILLHDGDAVDVIPSVAGG